MIKWNDFRGIYRFFFFLGGGGGGGGGVSNKPLDGQNIFVI